MFPARFHFNTNTSASASGHLARPCQPVFAAVNSVPRVGEQVSGRQGTLAEEFINNQGFFFSCE